MNAAAPFLFPAVDGLQATIGTGEIAINPGIPALSIARLPQAAGDAARDTISAAVRKCGLKLPEGRIIMSLPDHDPRQPSPRPDLTIAIAILAASGQIATPEKPTIYLGNLEPDGRISPTAATVSIALAARSQDVRTIYAPSANAAEAAVADGVTVYPVNHLRELTDHLRGKSVLEPCQPTAGHEPATSPYAEFSGIRAPAEVRRALEIAAAGRLPIMLSGPPGSGRTLLARVLTGIMPRLTEEDAIQSAAIRSLTGQNDPERPLSLQPPFRAPHHTISDAGLIGGGRLVKPGELSLSHRGVLFLDDVSEFSHTSQNAACDALDSGAVAVKRLSSAATYPAEFLLVAGTQPCPCGYRDAIEQKCVCNPEAAARHQRRTSDRLRDKMALHVNLLPATEAWTDETTQETSEQVRERVQQARQFKAARAECTPEMTPDAITLLHETISANCGQGRRRANVAATARTIADLEQSDAVRPEHIAEALDYLATATSAAPVRPEPKERQRPPETPNSSRYHQIPLALF